MMRRRLALGALVALVLLLGLAAQRAAAFSSPFGEERRSEEGEGEEKTNRGEFVPVASPGAPRSPPNTGTMRYLADLCGVGAVLGLVWGLPFALRV